MDQDTTIRRFQALVATGRTKCEALHLLHKLGRAERIVDAMEGPPVILGPGGEYRRTPSRCPGAAVLYVALGLLCIVAWAVAWRAWSP